MKQFLLVCFFIILTVPTSAQTITLAGTVTDDEGAMLPYVSVIARVRGVDSTFVAVTDGDGKYGMSVIGGDSCHVEFSFVGYETSEFNFFPYRTETRHDVVMHKDAAMLDEVMVEGNISVRQMEKTMYFPTSTQRKSTNNGNVLLYNMMIPELRVDSKTGEAVTNDGRAVTRCINGVSATGIDIKALRPSDIIRIDFYPVGTGRFAQYDAVVDFVVRNRDAGGYADIRTETRYLTPKGDYDVTVKQHCKYWSHTAVAGSAFIDACKSGCDSEENIALKPEFIKYSTVEYFKKKDFSVYGMYSALYSTDIATLKLSAGMTWNRTPIEDSRSSVSFSPTVFTATCSSVSQQSGGLSPSANADMGIRFSASQYVMLNAKYRYAHSCYERIYGEYDGPDKLISLFTDAESNSNVYGGSASYTNAINNIGSISLGIKALSEKYDTRYAGDTDCCQELSKWYYTLYAGYRHTIWHKLFCTVRLSVMNHHASINGVSDRSWLFLPDVSLSYNGGKAGHVMLSWRTIYVNPPIEWKSELSQRVNKYEILRGNDCLPHYTASQPFLSYSNSWKNMEINVYAGSMFASKSIRDSYLVENNNLVHTYDVCGSYFQALFGSQATFFALDRHMQLSGSVTYNIRKLNNVGADSFNDITYTMNALYNIGDVSFSAYYDSPSNIYGITSSPYYKVPPQYGASMSYSHGRWFAYVEAANFFGSRHYKQKIVSENNYRAKSKSYMDDYYASICLKLSYSLDFGHKKLERENMDVDRTINSGILRIGK